MTDHLYVRDPACGHIECNCDPYRLATPEEIAENYWVRKAVNDTRLEMLGEARTALFGDNYGSPNTPIRCWWEVLDALKSIKR